MIECAVLIPVLSRPERVEPTIVSLLGANVVAKATPYFVATQADVAECAALVDAQVAHFVLPGVREPGDYARKINRAVASTEEPWLFFGADDLRFEPGWLDAALEVADRHHKRVIGTNDLGNPAVKRGEHSTHSLIHRSYIEDLGTIDRRGVALHEGYDHQFVDNELVETALHRGEFAFAPNAVVEHLHPHWGKGPEGATYDLAVKEMTADRILFRQRRRLWRGGAVRRNGRR